MRFPMEPPLSKLNYARTFTILYDLHTLLMTRLNLFVMHAEDNNSEEL